MEDKIIRSPFFYVGDKYKLMGQLRELFPKNISTYIEPFVGGGSSFLNTKAQRYIVNDINYYIIALHKCLSSYAGKQEEFLAKLYSLIDKYGLSCSYRNITVPDELKKKYVKTYYSHFNKDAYSKMRADFNKEEDLVLLYILLIYGFNHMIRFNLSGKFNLPVGNVDFNKNVYNAIWHYLSFVENSDITFANMDFMVFLNELEFDENSYIYLDPPYLISGSEYNKYWNEEEERRLCFYLDELDKRGNRFGITNLINHRGMVNQIFLKWSKKYTVYNIESNYISFNDNTIKSDSKEVFVTNYGSK
nr:Dam family site-specific DNA-(adenine-N6)-methyltransferase [uncultured Catonella sp.]